MSYEHVDEGRQGAKRQHTKDFDIRKFVATEMEKDRNLQLPHLINILMDRVLEDLKDDDQDSLLALCDYGASNHFHALKYKYAPRERRASSSDDDADIEKKASEKAKCIVAKVDANILETLTLPSGKLLADSTREEIIKYRSDLGGLIKKLKPGQTPRQAGLRGF